MKTILLGMNNPQGNRPLWPDPPGCTGHRIWKMLTYYDPTIIRRQYMRRFERLNCLEDRSWDAAAARDNFCKNIRPVLRGRRVVLLGLAVARCAGLHRAPWASWYADGNLEALVCQLPHPSGLNHWYNERQNRELAAQILFKEYCRAVHLETSLHRAK